MPYPCRTVMWFLYNIFVVMLFKNGAHMTRIAVLLFISTISIQAFAQFSEIEPENPLPRVGQSVNLQIRLDRKDLSLLERKPELTGEETSTLHSNRVGRGSFRITEVFKDTGNVVVGPFTFVIGGETYVTNSIKLSVRPALPEGAREGLWVSSIRLNNQYYVVVEQRVPTSFKRDSNDPNTITLNSSGVNFAELDTDKLHERGLELISSSESTDNQFLGKDISTGVVSYKVTAYKFRALKNFSGSIKLDRSFFPGLPKHLRIEEAVIR